jgi:DnaJ-class molecular chaperone
MKQCRQCAGAGKIPKVERDKKTGEWKTRWVTCPACNGSGNKVR